MDEFDKLQQQQQDREAAWRRALARRIDAIVQRAASARAERVEEAREALRKAEAVRLQLQAQGALIDELERYHEFQKHAIALQEDALRSRSLEKEVEVLVGGARLALAVEVAERR